MSTFGFMLTYSIVFAVFMRLDLGYVPLWLAPFMIVTAPFVGFNYYVLRTSKG